MRRFNIRAYSRGNVSEDYKGQEEERVFEAIVKNSRIVEDCTYEKEQVTLIKEANEGWFIFSFCKVLKIIKFQLTSFCRQALKPFNYHNCLPTNASYVDHRL